MTTELDTRCLNTFPEWLRTLAADADDIAKLLSSATAPLSARRYVAAGLNYLFKSLDLIPDGIEDLGFLDDAFVLRVAASLALDENPAVRAEAPALHRLAADKALIVELLGKDYNRLERYVRDLTRGAARGRTVDEIIEDDGTRTAFLNEVAGWAQSYQAPSFSRDEKNIVKLQSFLSAKLPA
ncbi:YkvA family protein [Polyangium sp. y55x31]|uniref:DUF1232 domain-containing protein n=1 Tax=Polyangium sp. y55x31 TaxID=3042688 RepID=UPI002482D1BD|nr:YkvA family protein [Polyangium sp. y55x31]MDI1482468.1 YkvA family protein [Polyangium sp. y55x31]